MAFYSGFNFLKYRSAGKNVIYDQNLKITTVSVQII
jgi:hypothetical protein